MPRVVLNQPPWPCVFFGDGGGPAAFGKELRRAYAQAGLYVVTGRAAGPDDEPLTVKTRVVVDAATDERR